jgi:hypothetical protein
MRSNNSPLCPFCSEVATGDHFCPADGEVWACGGIEYPLVEPLDP